MPGLLKSALTVALTIALLTAIQIHPSGGKTMELNSPAFNDGGAIPAQYAMPAAGGKNISIPLSWSGAPEGTKSFALSIIDPHPVAKNWVHWLVVNIPAHVTSIPERASGGKMPAGAVELKNSYGSVGYGGPQPPRGTGEHPYVVTVHALDVDKLDLPADGDLDAFQKALEGKVIASAAITGMYGQR